MYMAPKHCNSRMYVMCVRMSLERSRSGAGSQGRHKAMEAGQGRVHSLTTRFGPLFSSCVVNNSSSRNNQKDDLCQPPCLPPRHMGLTSPRELFNDLLKVVLSCFLLLLAPTTSHTRSIPSHPAHARYRCSRESCAWWACYTKSAYHYTIFVCNVRI